MACGPKTADRLSESANVGAGVGKQIRRQINLKAADSEYERKWPRIIRSISPVEEYKCAGSSLAIECKGWLSWAGAPSAIFRRHYLNRSPPVRELSRWVPCSTPPQSGLRRRRASTEPDACKGLCA